MNNLVLYKGVYISKENFDEIKNMRQLSDDEIDLSDIPETTHEEFARRGLRKIYFDAHGERQRRRQSYRLGRGRGRLSCEAV